MASFRIALLTALMGLLCFIQAMHPSPANAQDGLQITVSQDTFGGYYKPGNWFPVVIRVVNQPTEGRPGDRSLDFNGSLIVQSSSAGSGSSMYNFRHDVSVPAFSTQQFVVYSRIRQNLPVPPTLEVRTSTGRRVKSEPIAALQSLPRNRILMVTVTDQMRRLYYPNPRGAASYVVEGNLPPGNLFDDWMGYDSVDVLVFPVWPEGRLTARSRAALEDWVSMGGTLVFLGGSNSAAYAAGETDTLLPVDVSSASRFALDESRGVLRLAPPGEELGDTPSVLLSNITPRPGTEVLVDAGTPENPVPALVQRRIGKGRVLFVGADFEGDSILARAVFAPMWQSVMPLPNPLDWKPSLSSALQETKTVTGRAARPPNLFLVVALCVIYTLIVGPVNFLLLGMTKRVQWAWFTVPAIVLVFTGLIYTIGIWTKGGQTITRETTILLGNQDDPRFEELSAYSIFVQNPGDYRAVPTNEKMAAADADPWSSSFTLAEGGFTGSLLTDRGTEGLGFAQRRPVIQSTGMGVRVESWPLRTFDTTQFLARGPHKREGGLRSTLAYANQNRVAWLEGDLTNETGLDFYASAIVTGNRGLSLGALKHGESISLDRTTSRFWFGQEAIVLWNVWGNVVEVMTARGNRDRDSDESLNRENAAVILRHIAHPYEVSRILPPLKGKIYFVGLAEENRISADLGLDADVQARSIIVLVELNPVPVANSFVVDPQLTSVNLVNYPEDYRFSYDSGAGMRGGFQQVMTGSSEPMLRLDRGAPLVVTVGLPFEHPGLRVRSVDIGNVELERTGASALFEATPLGLLTGGGRPSNLGLFSDSDGMFFTPGRGRGWIQMLTPRTEDQSATQAAGIRSIGVEVIGGIHR